MQEEDRYEIEAQIGEGGRGAVYRAYDRQLNRHVAIKRLFPGDAKSDESRRDVLKESHALSAINSPHIVRVFDVSQDEEGPYVVMELLDGKTLHEIVSRAPLVPQDFVTVAEQALEALIAAHEAKILHRDIKPGNLMLTWLPSGRIQLKLLDFGLAKFSEKPALQTVIQKEAGSVLGSIYFMAPEQFERRPLDARADLYALGCVLYYALTGDYPFQGDNATEVMASHIQGKFKELAPQRPDLAPAICEWVTRLLARDPEARPANAHDALEKFDKARKATAPVTSGPISSGPRLVTAAEAGPTSELAKTISLTGTQPVLTKTTGVILSGASHTTKVVHTTKNNGIPPWLYSLCGVLLVSVIALGVAMAMRGDPADDIPPPVPAPPVRQSTPDDAPAPADAGSGAPNQNWNAGREFLNADEDKNFKLSRAEFIAHLPGSAKMLRDQFQKLDEDEDGFLSRAEYRRLSDLDKKP